MLLPFLRLLPSANRLRLFVNQVWRTEYSPECSTYDDPSTEDGQDRSVRPGRGGTEGNAAALIPGCCSSLSLPESLSEIEIENEMLEHGSEPIN